MEISRAHVPDLDVPTLLGVCDNASAYDVPSIGRKAELGEAVFFKRGRECAGDKEEAQEHDNPLEQRPLGSL